MAKRTVKITNKLGLHARAAAKFVQTASGFESDINVRHGDREVSGKSIMGVMMLAAAKGSSVDLIANGRDEDQALDSLEKLVSERFGEAE